MRLGKHERWDLSLSSLAAALEYVSYSLDFGQHASSSSSRSSGRGGRGGRGGHGSSCVVVVRGGGGRGRGRFRCLFCVSCSDRSLSALVLL